MSPSTPPESKRDYPEIARLLGVVRRLRAPDGCPWDRAQTHASIVKNLVEESGEFIDALEDNNLEGIREELGDLLLQVALHCQIADESHEFDIEAVAAEEADKLIRRHPHVFGEKHAGSESEALDLWNASKVGEPGEQSRRTSRMDGVPRNMPGLSRIQKALRKAQKNHLMPTEMADGSSKAIAQKLAALMAALPADSSASKDASPILQAMLLEMTRLCHSYDLEAEELAHAVAKDFINACKEQE